MTTQKAAKSPTCFQVKPMTVARYLMFDITLRFKWEQG